ncbi:hypothetical protein GQ44DRAFT_673949 [Phaeosphaeriaceae sp. PMI808]|nr:hypothetical protein GQ44DRAFT_673949 [Phaeosphaeriaceae sp. PMI808]
MDSPEAQWASTRTPSSRPTSKKSTRSSRSARSHQSSRTTEQTPLLAREDRIDDERDDEPQTPATTALIRSLSGSNASERGSAYGSDSGKTPLWKKRWPSILALIVLCIVIIFIMFGFLASKGIEEYAMQAADFRPTKLSLDGLVDQGANVHIEGDFSMDASKVKKQNVRNLGRFATWIGREAETGSFDAHVYLPEYGNVLIGTAKIPSIKVNIRNGYTTHISFVTNVQPGSPDGIRNIANDWIDGRLGQIRIKGKAEVPLKSGLINIGKQIVEQSMVLKENDIPTLPHYNITKLNIREAKPGRHGMGADASILVTNEFPVQVTLPPVAVDVLIDGCSSDKHIFVGTAETAQLDIKPKTDLEVNVTGNVDHLSSSLTEVCPDSAKSPLDAFIGEYMKGDEATIYINCCKFPDPNTPEWARGLLKDITVPVPFAGRDMGNLVKNFTMANMHFSLPDPFAEPGTPEAAPKISAVIKVDVGLPNEMNFPLDVNQVKADADIYYKNKKLGNLNLEKWQKANSTRVEAHGKEGPSLLVQSQIKNAPVEILDDDLFSEVIQALIFGGKPINLDMKAMVSVGMNTPMGKFAIRGIPAKGTVPVKLRPRPATANVCTAAIHGGKSDDDTKPKFSALNVRVGNLSIVDTTPTSMTLQVHVNMTNPTNYSATVPYMSINILVNGTVLGQALIKDMSIKPGNNTNLIATALWDPYTNSGEKGKAVGAEMLSQYISGFNISVTLQAHDRTIPAQPGLSHLMSKYPITLPAPHLSHPRDPNDGDDGGDGDDDDNEPPREHFIQSATMHLITSTATFTLNSPFQHTTLFITHMNATAYYENQTAGVILYDLPFAVPPGLSDSPRIPVQWSFDSIGYGAIRKALGGQLKLTAFAHVGVRIGRWNERIWFKGGRLGQMLGCEFWGGW